MKIASGNVDQMQVFLIINKDGMKINTDDLQTIDWQRNM